MGLHGVHRASEETAKIEMVHILDHVITQLRCSDVGIEATWKIQIKRLHTWQILSRPTSTWIIQSEKAQTTSSALSKPGSHGYNMIQPPENYGKIWDMVGSSWIIHVSPDGNVAELSLFLLMINIIQQTLCC